MRQQPRRLAAWGLAFIVMSCGAPATRNLTAGERQAVADTVLTLFDSLAAIHTTHPDTGLLRRIHPPSDVLLFIEGGIVEAFTGDSLYRRVVALHGPVTRMTQRFSSRRGLVLDVNHAVLTATEDVDWSDTRGAHQWHGTLTLVVTRRGTCWVIRSYDG